VLKLFLDASVIIAALLSPMGGSAKLIEFIKLRQVFGITSRTVVDEIESKTDKIRKTREQIGKFITSNLIIVRKRVTFEEIESFVGLVEAEDAHLIAGAKLTNCDYLVTLDKKHLLKPDIKNKFKPLKIVPPAEILHILFDTGSERGS
jgi:putative PIN family toxin of toxin-antitoxin system